MPIVNLNFAPRDRIESKESGSNTDVLRCAITAACLAAIAGKAIATPQVYQSSEKPGRLRKKSAHPLGGWARASQPVEA
jgi:hypothetical protein